MKKYFTSLILLIFIFNIFGYYVPYYVIRSLIRAEMNEKAENFKDADIFEKITFDISDVSNQIVWTRRGKEFRYNNEMYDVVKAEIKKNTVTYYCIHDKDEKELTQVFDTLVRNNSSTNKKSDINSLKELSKYNYHTNNLLILNQNACLQNLFIKDLYISIHRDINLPPPKLV